MAAVVFPWPSRAERRARIADARRRAEHAQRQAGEARTLTAELHQLRHENHVAEALDRWISKKAKEQQ